MLMVQNPNNSAFLEPFNCVCSFSKSTLFKTLKKFLGNTLPGYINLLKLVLLQLLLYVILLLQNIF